MVSGARRRTVGVPFRIVSNEALPPDPFGEDPDSVAWASDGVDVEHEHELSDEDRAELVEDLANLAVYQALLAPRGIRGIEVDCPDCEEPHYHDWELLRSSLRQLLDEGRMRRHEPAFEPDPRKYVTWEYCRGFADGVTAVESNR